LVTFALLKQYFSAAKFNLLDNPQSNRIVRMLGAWFASSPLRHNAEALISLGSVPYMLNSEVYLRVDRSQARRARHHDGSTVPPSDLGREAQGRSGLTRPLRTPGDK
jgi:hypothetical protein